MLLRTALYLVAKVPRRPVVPLQVVVSTCPLALVPEGPLAIGLVGVADTVPSPETVTVNGDAGEAVPCTEATADKAAAVLKKKS